MKVSGERKFLIDRELIYDAATDLAGLASEFDQVSNVEQIDTATVRITIHLNFGVYSGDYYADLSILDADRPRDFSIVGRHKSKLGGMMLRCKTTLSSDERKITLVCVEGDFARSGMLRFANKTIVRKGVEFGIRLMFDTIEKRAELYT